MTTLSLQPPSQAVRRPAGRRSHSRARALFRLASRGTLGSVKVFAGDVFHGLVGVSRNMLALVGLMLAIGVVFAVDQRELRHGAEEWTLGWLRARQEARDEPSTPVSRSGLRSEVTRTAAADPDADATAPPAPATDLKQLSRQQASVAQWLARRYHVAPEPVGHLVQEAWTAGQKAGLDPTLILAIMAVESSFNPFAQSAVGAQGLMQVMTKVHNEKYQAFGGNRAAFDPVTNLKVGVQVLKECIARAGSIDGGLRSYVGAGPLGEDGGYAGKVLFEQSSLKMVANGKSVPPQRAVPRPAPEVLAKEPRSPRDEPATPAAEPTAATTDNG